MDHAGRRRRLADRLPALEVDALLVTRLANVRYLSGFTGSNGQLLLTSGDAWLLTDSRYGEQARREAPDLRREVYPRDVLTSFGDLCREAGARRIGFEAAGVSYKTHDRLASTDGVTLVPLDGEIEAMRWVKEPEELALIAGAQAITDEAFERVTGKLVEGMTERNAAWELHQTMMEAGADGIAFEPIVAFGEQAAEPHHRPGDSALARGDVVKLDFGCTVSGYNSDMTRTVAFGEPPAEIREIHDLVLRAQQAGIDALSPGVLGGDVDEASRAVIRDGGHDEGFGHSLGHGVGLEVHEGPTLRKASEDRLPEGSVVTVEPGVYLPGVGGVRIEDMVLIAAAGPRPLPRAPRELLVL